MATTNWGSWRHSADPTTAYSATYQYDARGLRDLDVVELRQCNVHMGHGPGKRSRGSEETVLTGMKMGDPSLANQ